MSKRQVHRAANAVRHRRHFVRADEPSATSTRLQRAVCGEWVSPFDAVRPREDVTCLDCLRWIQDFETARIG